MSDTSYMLTDNYHLHRSDIENWNIWADTNHLHKFDTSCILAGMNHLHMSDKSCIYLRMFHSYRFDSSYMPDYTKDKDPKPKS